MRISGLLLRRDVRCAASHFRARTRAVTPGTCGGSQFAPLAVLPMVAVAVTVTALRCHRHFACTHMCMHACPCAPAHVRLPMRMSIYICVHHTRPCVHAHPCRTRGPAAWEPRGLYWPIFHGYACMHAPMCPDAPVASGVPFVLPCKQCKSVAMHAVLGARPNGCSGCSAMP